MQRYSPVPKDSRIKSNATSARSAWWMYVVNGITYAALLILVASWIILIGLVGLVFMLAMMAPVTWAYLVPCALIEVVLIVGLGATTMLLCSMPSERPWL